MKVVCINNVIKSGGGHLSYHLTIGKVYDSLKYDRSWSWIKDKTDDNYLWVKNDGVIIIVTGKNYL